MAKSRSLSHLLLHWVLAFHSTTQGAEVPYHFFDFEAPLFSKGILPDSIPGLSLRQGKAQIAPTQSQDDHGQYLVVSPHHPHGALLLTSKRVAADQRSHAEIWVRPQATDPQAGEEIIDFDGAVVGLFRRPNESYAEFHAFHQTSKDTGYWLSTGRLIQLDDQGKAQQWHRLNITQNWAEGTWSLKIDGELPLAGLSRSGAVDPQRFECWLFGQEQGACDFDDLLVTPIDPDQLEANAIVGRISKPSPTAQRQHSVPTKASSKQAGPRRQATLPKSSHEIVAKPSTFDVHLKVVGGGKHLTEFDVAEQHNKARRIALYSPGYDADGSPLPLKVEIRSDGHLSEGLVLADLQWAITEFADPKQPKPLQVIVHGNFSSGPTQTATVPSNWSNKPLSITIAPHLIDQARKAPP